MAQFAARISAVYSRWPVLSNVVIYGSLYGLGDASRQTITREPQYNWSTTASTAAVGGVALGPLYYYWYRVLDRALPGVRGVIIVKKLLADQLVAGSVGISIYFCGTRLLEGKREILHELKTKGLKAWLTGFLYWPAIQTINFLFLPPHMRTVYVAGAAFIWTNVLSYIKASSPTSIYTETPDRLKIG